jgi:hypothetical protein
MKAITEARRMTSHFALRKSTPAATDRPYLTAWDVLRAGIYRAATRKEMVAAQSIWDSEGGATETSERPAGTPRFAP